MNNVLICAPCMYKGSEMDLGFAWGFAVCIYLSSEPEKWHNCSSCKELPHSV